MKITLSLMLLCSSPFLAGGSVYFGHEVALATLVLLLPMMGVAFAVLLHDLDRKMNGTSD